MIGVYGTAYHTGDAEDWENVVADKCGIDKIGAHEWVDVNGCIFDIKHKVGGSSVPYGKKTAITKEQLWNLIWADHDLCPHAHVVLRGHVHTCEGGFRIRKGKMEWAMTVPALQAMGSKFGSRQCSGLVDWGMLHFDVGSKGEIEDWGAHIIDIPQQRSEAFVV